MIVQEKKIKDLKEYENNPRNNENAIGAVAESIKQFGFRVPIVIDKNNVIVCGHTRLKAAERLNIETVPCVIADDMTEEQIKAYRLADNKTNELSEWDFNKLDLELFELQNINMEQFGFKINNISADAFGEDFELADDDKPQARTITLSLCEEQYLICQSVIDYFTTDKVKHDYGNNNKRSNAIFEAVYLWAEQNKLC